VGVEGRIIYVAASYRPTFSDNVQENTNGGQFMTGNVAYRKNAIEAVGGFDERIVYLADRDIGLRTKKHGRICFNANMIAFHPQVILTPSRYVKLAPRIENRVYLFKRFGEKESFLWRIVSPFDLAKIFFPELVLADLFFGRFKKKEDFKLLPYTYVYAVLERLHLWKTCAKERVFLI
jgi:GT2 family glycosyltransferase